MKLWQFGFLLLPSLALAESGLPARDALQKLDQAAEPGFGVCAAYYFLAARGHPVTDYDALYTAGEFSLNSATVVHGRTDGPKQMEQASGRMMAEMDQDWRRIEVLDKHYAPPCDALLKEAGYAAP